MRDNTRSARGALLPATCDGRLVDLRYVELREQPLAALARGILARLEARHASRGPVSGPMQRTMAADHVAETGDRLRPAEGGRLGRYWSSPFCANGSLRGTPCLPRRGPLGARGVRSWFHQTDV
jgi:hypothetical protein